MSYREYFQTFLKKNSANSFADRVCEMLFFVFLVIKFSVRHIWLGLRPSFFDLFFTRTQMSYCSSSFEGVVVLISRPCQLLQIYQVCSDIRCTGRLSSSFDIQHQTRRRTSVVVVLLWLLVLVDHLLRHLVVHLSKFFCNTFVEIVDARPVQRRV